MAKFSCMNHSELKQQVLSAIDVSPLLSILPGFCAGVRQLIEEADISESDSELFQILVDLFQNPEEWFKRVSSRMPDNTILDKLRALGPHE